ncbi:hypothetical protein HPB49_014396 [Dermacentor silvarum]|uniref:Uncharacterized protein n=1 Tax=Dermacentor silvarum TaxID=543639 RepID=A0ACB8DJF6_DERSI|nr:hypothetical protein HPB49_014396 [Dermacentor silvarum]
MLALPQFTPLFHAKSRPAPDGPPRDLRHSTSAAFLEVLTWSEVACDLANGEIRSYYLKLHSGDPWEMETHEHNATSTVHTFVNLAPFTRYAAKVFAQNDAGRSPYFASVNFTTAPFPPPQPTDLLASHLTQDSVRVSWNAPYPPHGVLDNYRLLFWSGNDKSKATEITIVHEECRRRRRFVARHCYTVKGLEPRSVYRFSVRAANKGTSYSPYSAELVTKTKDSVPVIKRAPGVDAVDGNTVTLNLTPVDFHNGPLTAYYLLVVKKVHEVVAPIRLVNFSSAEDLHLGYYVGASFTAEEVGDGIRFVVGAGDTVGGFANPPLEAGAPYSFGWAAETNFSGSEGSVLTSDPRISEPISGVGNTYWPFIAGSLLCLAAMALATTGILCCCRKRRSSHRWPPDIAAVVLEERVAEEPKFVEKSAIDRKTQRAEMNEYISTDSKSAAPAAGGSAPSRPSNPVPIKRFQEYVTRALVEGTLELEYTADPISLLQLPGFRLNVLAGHLKTLCTLLFQMKPQFFLESVTPPGCWAAKSTTPPVARKKMVALLAPTLSQVFIQVEHALSGAIGVIGKKYHLTVEVSAVDLPT